MKIFQAYYKLEQMKFLDEEFTAFDNTANPIVNLHEFYIYRMLYDEAQTTNENLWGHFSWQWKRKMPGVSAHAIINQIELSPGFDVYTFHPFPHETALHWNVWEQGQWCHPHLITLGEQILKHMGEDLAVMHKPMGTRDYLCVNYFVGNIKFWEKLLNWLSRFAAALESLPSDYRKLLEQSAGYGDNPNLDYRGFLCERMISSFLVRYHNEISVKPFNTLYDERLTVEQQKLLSLKDHAIETNKKCYLEEYLNKRPVLALQKDWGNQWINSCVL